MHKELIQRLRETSMDFGEADHVSVLLLEAANAIEDLETIKRKTGVWIGEGDGYANGNMVYDMWSCGRCGTRFDEWEEKPTWEYCPVCGSHNGGDDDV